MSTKTSIKRIALVAAAALALGGFSAVSASAASATTITQVANTGDGGAGGIAGPANTIQVTITPDSSLTTKKDYVTVTGGSILSADSTTTTVASTGASATTVGTVTLTISTPSVGNIVINAYDAATASTYSSTVSVTKTIAVAAAGVSGVFSAAKSTVFMAAGDTNTWATADATVNVPSTSKAIGDTTSAVASIQVRLNDANGTGLVDSVSATITSGPGTIAGTTDSNTAAIGTANAQTYSAVLNTSANGSAIFQVWPNGQVGTSTIVIKNGAGTVLSTKSITFAGTTVAKITVTVKKAYVLNSTTETTKVFALKTYDSADNEITASANPFTVTVATGSTVGSAASLTQSTYSTDDGVYYVGAKAGSASSAGVDADETYTFTVGTVTASAKVKFVSGVLTTVSIAGPASADPGSKTTYTLTALGAGGNPMPDATYAPASIFTAADPSTNASLVAIPFGKGETITLAAGTATDYTYAPFSGSLSASWTLLGTAGGSAIAASSATDVVTAAGIAKTLVGTTVTAEDVAVSANTEATAAANAATDAANQAADAADNATQAAAEALAAVNTLATTVATLIAGIKSQIKALNALIVKIKNKLKA